MIYRLHFASKITTSGELMPSQRGVLGGGAHPGYGGAQKQRENETNIPPDDLAEC